MRNQLNLVTEYRHRKGGGSSKFEIGHLGLQLYRNVKKTQHFQQKSVFVGGGGCSYTPVYPVICTVDHNFLLATGSHLYLSLTDLLASDITRRCIDNTKNKDIHPIKMIKGVSTTSAAYVLTYFLCISVLCIHNMIDTRITIGKLCKLTIMNLSLIVV